MNESLENNPTDPLQDLHQEFTTRPDEITALVARITTQSLVQIEPVMRGIDNEVHIVKTAHDATFYLHVRRHGELPFADIAWALAQARRAGALVPEVLFCEPVWLDGAEREVMIQTAILGRPLQDLFDELSDEQLRQCYQQAMPMLAMIHSIPVAGYQMRRDAVWDFHDWESLTRTWLQQRQAAHGSLQVVGFTEDESSRLLAALGQLLQRFPCVQPVLLQGDFTPGHLFFDDTLKFTGLVDFGQFQGGSPVFDIDLILPNLYEGGPLWANRIQTDWLQESYGPAPFWDTLTEQRLLYALYNDLGVLHRFVTNNQVEPLAIIVPGLRKLLNLAETYLGI